MRAGVDPGGAAEAGRALYGLLVPMRDGVKLALDVRFPPGEGSFPVVLIRTMYDKVEQRDAIADPARGIPYDGAFVNALLAAGYALAVEDVRGRFDSDGDWHPYVNERRDGFDTVEWVFEQPWCDGNIGMIGRSYVGYTQLMAAAGAPRGLKAIVPISPQIEPYQGYPVVNGVFLLAMAELGIKGGRHSFQIRDFMRNVMVGSEPYFDTLPIADMFKAAGVVEPPWWTEMMDHPNRDAYWRQGVYADAWPTMGVATLGVTGWYDLVVEGAIVNLEGLQRHAASEAVRAGQELIVGPWAHWVNIRTGLNGVDYGPGSLIDLEGYVISFLNRWLKPGSPRRDEKPVHIFVMGADEWWEADSWPLPGAEDRPFYLHGGGGEHGAGGRLDSVPPAAGAAPEVYRDDPRDPVTSAFSMHAGPVDDRDVAAREDVLVYLGEPLEEPLTVVGVPRLVLHAASSAPDTDWHVRLLDAQPDGSLRFVAHGVLRARFRDSFEQPSLLKPGATYRYEICLTPTAIRFARGHRIAIELMSSWFPRFERNMNSGSPNNHRDADPHIAVQVVMHDAVAPTRLVLPVVPEGTYRGVEFAPRCSRSGE